MGDYNCSLYVLWIATLSMVVLWYAYDSPTSRLYVGYNSTTGALHISVLTGCLTHLGPAWASWGQLVPAGASWYNTLKLASCHVHRPCPNPLQSPHRVMTSK